MTDALAQTQNKFKMLEIANMLSNCHKVIMRGIFSFSKNSSWFIMMNVLDYHCEFTEHARDSLHIR